MTLEQLQKFCKSKETLPSASSWQEGPFSIDKWQVATDGYILIAAMGHHRLTQLPELEKGGNREKILEWISFPIPTEKYSLEHLQGFLGDKPSTECAHPMIFSGHRIDRAKLYIVASMATLPYSFSIRKERYHHCFHFQFGSVIAMIMGMIEHSESDPRYEPKPLQVNQPQIVLR